MALLLGCSLGDLYNWLLAGMGGPTEQKALEIQECVTLLENVVGPERVRHVVKRPSLALPYPSILSAMRDNPWECKSLLVKLFSDL